MEKQKVEKKVEHNENKKNKSLFGISCLLTFLYFLQGLVVGLLLETFQFRLKKDFSYSEIGVFLLCSYPFSLKILWSALVDSYYIRKIGRRKTWILSTQTFAALILFYMAKHIDEILTSKNIIRLSVICFALMFLIASQDIAVDGWAITLCASSCQTIGQVIGIFVSTSVFISLSSAEFCQRFLTFIPTDKPLLNMSSYLTLIAACFLLANFILVNIHEYDDCDPNDIHSLSETLLNIKKMIQNKLLIKYILITLISKIGFIFYGSILPLHLIDKGVFTQETLTNISTLFIPLQIFFSYYLSNINKNLLKNYLKGFKTLILINLIEFLFLINLELISTYLTKWVIISLIIIVDIIKTEASVKMFNCSSGFNHKICDNRIGATYITALNSAANLSQKWPGVFVFSAVDKFGAVFVGGVSLVYSVGYYWGFEGSIERFESEEEKMWKIKED